MSWVLLMRKGVEIVNSSDLCESSLEVKEVGSCEIVEELRLIRVCCQVVDKYKPFIGR